MERILQRPLIVVPVFERETKEGKDDEVDGCIFDQSQTNISPKTMQSRDKHGDDHSTGKQQQRKFTKKFDASATFETLKSKLVEGLYNAADDEDDFVGSKFGDMSSDDVSAVRSLTKGHKIILTDNKVDLQAFLLDDSCLPMI